jgi:hypothetical protein
MLARKAACLAAAALAGLVGALVSVPAGAQAPDGSSLVALTASTAAPPPQGSVMLGPVRPRKVISAQVILKVAHPAALSAFIAGLSDRRSPLFHQFLRPGQFGARFGPPLSQVSAVRNALRSAGLSPGPVAPDRLAIPVTGSAAAIERAFGTRLVRYRLPGGRVAYRNLSAPRVPAAVAPYLGGVLGLSDVDVPRSMAVPPRRPARRRALTARLAADVTALPAASSAAPKPCAAAVAARQPDGSFTADELASHYGMSALYSLGDLGQGVRVALAEFGPDSPADISAYESCYGLTTSVSYITVNGGAGTGAGSGEAALDIENVMGLAPRAAIDVYQGPDGSSADTYDLYSAIVNHDTDKVVSTSWGLCELDSDQSLIRSEDTLFAQAAAQGQTVLAAAGDFGSTGCLFNPLSSDYDSTLSVTDPAGQPYVVGVGGTSIGATSQSVWNNSSSADGAGAGGLSADWCMPAYQYKPAIPGLISKLSGAAAASCGTAVPYLRQVPDVSADANPQTGYVIYFTGTWQAGWGGTSAAASLWAAAAALADASPFCSDYGSGDAGVRPEGLYAVTSAHHSYIYSSSAEALSDVTSGDNDYTPSGYTGGEYPAAKGYDMASGLGTPLVSGRTPAGRTSTYYPGLAALMCWQYGTKLRTARVTSISPRQGTPRHSHTITVHGSGFLPIAGADIAEVGSRRLAATCTSTTKCTVVLPALRAQTVNVRISVEDLILSPVTAADRFRYL